MKLLIDTNVFLEILLDQEKAEEARALLVEAGEHEFFISDYSLHSIGVLFFRRRQHHVFREFVNDMVLETGMMVMAPMLEEIDSVIDAAQEFKLDFDDAYQYATAEKYGLTIVSFDSDFDRTKRGRKTPAEVLP